MYFLCIPCVFRPALGGRHLHKEVPLGLPTQFGLCVRGGAGGCQAGPGVTPEISPGAGNKSTAGDTEETLKVGRSPLTHRVANPHDIYIDGALLKLGKVLLIVLGGCGGGTK